ncbi:MAG: cobalt-precorrin 5A hydrolase [Deltaproteobacteria bacterium]|nr:cobalt-precorrin 5A hydrolase [Deltaproteobacteria bacterium]
MNKTTGNRLTVFPVTEAGYLLAKRLERGYEWVRAYSPGELKGGGLKRLAAKAFKEKSAILFISASGIAVRTIAPLIKGKDKDPAVMVMDEKGRFVVSLLSGHLGGANALTKKMAAFFKSTPVITTATDINNLPCVEEIAKRLSCAVEDHKKIKAINSAILKGAAVTVIDRNKDRLAAARKRYARIKNFRFSLKFPAKPSDGAFIFISSVLEEVPENLKDNTITLRPGELVVGIGCRSGVSVKEVGEAVNEALRSAMLSPLSIKKIATIDIKKDEKGLVGFAKKIGAGLGFFSADELCKIKFPSKKSKFVLKTTGAGGVSEPAALISAGVRKVCLKKKKLGRVTVAAAREPFTS